ncbi:MAG: rhodanese-like domain-containing protein [Telluria sp.]|nr:rhodanese-like domain-containing protein [Telluria sp.]
MKRKAGKIFWAGVLLAVLTAGAALAAPNAIGVRQAAALQRSGALLLDVREPEEYAQGHAPGSTLIPLGQLQSRLRELDAFKGRRIAIICRSGRRSALALQMLERAGYSAAANVEGGMIAWTKAGLPIKPGPASR